MKKRWLSFIFTACMFVCAVLGLAACGDGAVSTPTPPQKLTAPVVVLTENIASWEADENADKFEMSLDGNLSYVENTVTSKALTAGQTFKLRAVGDGLTYTTSDWSNSVTYVGSEPPAPQPTKLGTPFVTISSSGLASWGAVANASGYIYKLGGGAETATSATSVQLTNGQSIVVKAVGDGTNYTDSDYSVAQTYTENTPTPPPTPTPTEAPTYLGIIASKEEPTENDAPAGLLRSYANYGARASLEDALREYLSDEKHSLGDPIPTESDYEIYSAAGNTVYIQIWLENPDQNTILSLKLNGTKYQSGGALQSFFIEDGDSYLNCVYVAVTIPSGSHSEIAYTVTEIEYVEGANVSQDGKAVLIDENNDTVLIGLPYAQDLPIATISGEATTASSISFDVNVTDEDGFVDVVGGWLRAVIYNQSNEILAQQKLSNGNNSVAFNQLNADTYYTVLVFVLGDARDGNGVYVHAVANARFRTESVISATITSEILQNEQTGKYYPSISVEASLGDDSFTFTKIDVGTWDDTLLTLDFDGSIKITENILNNQSYVVRIYYESASGVEQSYVDNVYVERLDYPWIVEPCLQYGLLDDAILGFDLGDNKSNFDNLTIQIMDEYSKQYIAEDAIYLLENPNAIAELEAQWRSMGRDDPNFHPTYDRWYKLDQAQTKINEYYPDVEKAEWESERAKGIYAYEFVYGEDEQFFRVGNKYYAVLDGYQSKRINDYSWKYTLSADFDLNDGSGVEAGRTIIDGWIDIKPAIGKSDYLFDEEFTLDENGVVYLEVKSRNNLGDESYRELGYVNQIVLADGYEILQVLWSQEEAEHEIDEAAWMADVINALKAGEEVTSVFPLGELAPISFDIDDVEMPADLVGAFDIRFTYIMYGKTYTEENPYDWDGSTIAYTVKGQLPQVTIAFTDSAEDFGRWSVASPDWVQNGIWNFSYSIEVRDAEQNLVEEANYGEYQERLPMYYSIRVRLDSWSGGDYYTQGEWSDWFTCLPITLSTPTSFTQAYELDGVNVEWGWVDGAEKYVYAINGGAEQEISERVISGLKNGDTVKVKAIPATDSNYAESAYSEAYTVIDGRTQLATPTNLRVENKMLTWSAVENATYYEIEYMQGEQPIVGRTDSAEYYNANIGNTYRVRACSENVEAYKASEWSEGFTYTVTLENPSFSHIRSEKVYWNSVEYAEGYYYKIGESGEVNSTRRYYLALSEIPVGEKLYVQAYATGCENTEWMMIYHNVTKLATPELTVSYGTASWNAIENATGYVYKINGVEQSTTETSVVGLNAGDTITVCATTDAFGYVNSDWSEERTQAPILSAPTLNTSLFASEGTISWGAVDGATAYEYELDGIANTVGETSVSDIAFGQSIKVRALCDNGEYEACGEWTELVVREDTREQLATPIIAYTPEIGLTVAINDPKVSYYEVMFGQGGYTMRHYPPDGAYETEVITNSFAFPSDDHTVYVRAVPNDGNYRESEWATLVISFE